MEAYEQDIIIEQIIAALDGRAGRDEVLSLQAWVALSEQNRTFFAQIRNIYEMSDRRFDPATIRSDIALQKTLKRITPYGRRFRLGLWLQRVAAVLFIPLLAASVYYYVQQSHPEAPEINYCEMRAVAGIRSSFTLPDNSSVWLNSGSKIKYPERFSGDERTVYLEGEAFFEVAPDAEHPFTVFTPTIQVRATGTTFHVADFAGNPYKEVSLLSGKVAISKREPNELTTHLFDLLPGQHLDYSINTLSTRIAEGDLYKYYAWKDNKLVFRNDLMTDVVKRISQLYGVEIELQGEELKSYRYRATFADESLYEILRLLQLSAPINFREQKRKQQPDGSFTPSKIVIYPIK